MIIKNNAEFGIELALSVPYRPCVSPYFLPFYSSHDDSSKFPNFQIQSCFPAEISSLIIACVGAQKQQFLGCAANLHLGVIRRVR